MNNDRKIRNKWEKKTQQIMNNDRKKNNNKMKKITKNHEKR